MAASATENEFRLRSMSEGPLACRQQIRNGRPDEAAEDDHYDRSPDQIAAPNRSCVRGRQERSNTTTDELGVYRKGVAPLRKERPSIDRSLLLLEKCGEVRV